MRAASLSLVEQPGASQDKVQARIAPHVEHAHAERGAILASNDGDWPWARGGVAIRQTSADHEGTGRGCGAMSVQAFAGQA